MITPSFSALRRLTSVLLAPAIVSCSSGDGNGPSGTFSVSAPTTITVQAGSSATVQVTVTRSGGFSEDVTLTLEDHPGSLTHDTPTASGPTTTVTVTFTVAAAMAPSTYLIRACGSAAGMNIQCATISLTVTPGPTGDFTLSLNPASISIEQGQTKTVAITLARTAPFTGPVTLDVAHWGGPYGVTFSFDPAVIPAGATTSTATITVAANAPPMVYTGEESLWIVGTASDDLRYDAPLLLTVTAYPGEFSLAVVPGDLTVEQGKSGTASITIARTAPFSGEVSLTLEGAPAGLAGSLAPAVIPAGATASTLTLSPAITVAPGVHALIVHATGTGVPERTAPVTLTVTETAGFTLQAGSVGVQQGQVGGAGIRVFRQGGFTGPVNLALEGALPAGVTAALVSPTIPAGEELNAITFSMLATAPVGLHHITLHGTASGVPDFSLQVTFEVRAAPAGNVTFTFCSAPETPTWFGYQDGAGQWTQVAGPGGVFNFPITSETGGVAWVVPWQDEPGFYVGMILATQAELVELGSLWCQQTPVRKSHTGAVANVGTDWYNVSIGDASVEVRDGTQLNYQLDGVPAGVSDLVASKTTIPIGLIGSTMIIRRGINYPAGGVIPLLDFASPEAFLTTTMNATVENVGLETFRFKEAYVTASGTLGLFAHRSPKTATTVYMVVPPAHTQPGEFYNVKVEASLQQGGLVGRMVVKSFDVPADVTLTVGPALTPPSVFTLQAAPLYQVRVVSTWQAEYGNVFNGGFTQNTRDGEFFVTRGYLGGGGTIDVTTPDLRAVPGWNAAWGPVSGAITVLRGEAYGWTGAAGALFPGFLADYLTTPNVTMRSAALSKVTTP